MRIFFSTILIFYSLSEFGQNTDINLLRQININRNKNFDNTFIYLTKSAVPISVTMPVVIYSVGYFGKKNEFKTIGITMVASIVLSTAIATGLKYSVNRTRPFDKYSEIEQVIPVHTASFPSGHTSSVFTTATSLSIAFPKWYVIAPSYIWAGSVAFSRMHLGEHYPSDVVAGAVIGIGSAYLIYFAQKWLLQKQKKTDPEI